MVSHSKIYQHFHQEEYPFIDRMSDMINRVEDYYLLEVTEFLNAREVMILKSLIALTDLKMFVSTDYYPSEYGRVIIAPGYYDLEQSDFQIALVEISYQAKFNQLTHSQILGTLINELGVKRNLFGDVFVEMGYAQLMIKRELLDYFLGTITKIAKTSVKLREVNFDQLIRSIDNSQTLDILVSSFRLDGVVATILKKSRTQVIALIEANKIKVNYRLANKASDNLVIGDMVSIRGHGRFTLLADNGVTKHGKQKITLSKMIHK
ncbi:TPA: RNA-binding protein [Streptococcus pyogenes]|nr:RNA-binding protein [Streptococcus pyogenes]